MDTAIITVRKRVIQMINPQVKIHSLDDLQVRLPLDRSEVVFTNGCFDILHYGHLKYLLDARQLGKILIVAVNSDESVKRLKGDSRPVNPVGIRMYQLAALEFVDFVFQFPQETPFTVISKLKPGILVKGGDYEIHEIVGHDIVPKTISLPFVEGYSTTDLINKLKSP